MRVVPYGLRLCKVRNLLEMKIVGNALCVVLLRIHVIFLAFFSILSVLTGGCGTKCV